MKRNFGKDKSSFKCSAVLLQGLREWPSQHAPNSTSSNCAGVCKRVCECVCRVRRVWSCVYRALCVSCVVCDELSLEFHL